MRTSEVDSLKEVYFKADRGNKVARFKFKVGSSHSVKDAFIAPHTDDTAWTDPLEVSDELTLRRNVSVDTSRSRFPFSGATERICQKPSRQRLQASSIFI
ncbi:hypothetical protein BaRGS_00029580, partial [Batillaria attramentaria]